MIVIPSVDTRAGVAGSLARGPVVRSASSAGLPALEITMKWRDWLKLDKTFQALDCISRSTELISRAACWTSKLCKAWYMPQSAVGLGSEPPWAASGREPMLWVVAVVAFVLWIVAFGLFHAAAGLVDAALVVAALAAIYDLVTDRHRIV